ncbi:MAG: HsdM family class I SAM-dependent methyltransferase [Candidatus Phytoplasma sp. TWB_XP]
MGDCYIYLLAQFAYNMGKKGGQFYTPTIISTLLAKITTSHKQKPTSIYDPTCGSGSLLLSVINELKKNYKNKGLELFNSYENVQIYGQEIDDDAYNLSQINMILHDISLANINIYKGDTLLNPCPRTQR